MLAHGGAGQRGQLALGLRFDANQGQIGRAAAHIDHQHQTAVRQLLSQLLALQQQPVVKRRFGFFQQMHIGQTRQLRSFQRQSARAFVKRSGHREHHGLLLQWGIGVRRIPGRFDMGQIRGRGVQRRHLGDIFCRTPGQDGRRAVHARV